MRQILKLLLLIPAASIFLACSPESDNSDVLAQSFPICSDRAIDPNGDGWGWEEDLRISCRMPQDEKPPGANLASCTYAEGTCTTGNGSCRIFNDDGSRSSVKTQIWEEMYRINKDRMTRQQARCRADLAVAMAMQEAHAFRVDRNGNLPYDASKDNRRDGAQNVTIFNMNIDFIRMSCKEDCGRFQNFNNNNEKKYLNHISRLDEGVRRLNEGFDHFGIDGTLHFHRGGRNGWQRPGSDERNFARSQKVVAAHMRDNPETRRNGARISHSIPHR